MKAHVTVRHQSLTEKTAPLALTRVPAGFPSPADDYVEEVINLDDLCQVNPNTSFYVRADGHSMINSGIWPGDVLSVRKDLDARDGNTVIASIDGEFFVKTYRVIANGVVFESANNDYPPLVPEHGQDVRIWGVVVALVRVLRRPSR